PHLAEPGDEGRQTRARGQITAVVADIHAGQRDLAVPRVHQRLDLFAHDVGLLAAAAAAGRGHDAERAAVLAAVLDLDEGPRAPGPAGERRDGNTARCPDIAHADLRPHALAEIAEEVDHPILLL